MDLPVFRYHPDPVGTGNVRQSNQECMCCGEQRGLIYLGPVFAEDELNEARVAPDGTVWAAKIAAACRCAQEVREFGPDPAVGN